jgi:serine/threonine-protein kinase
MAELYLATSVDPARAREIVVVKRVLPQFAQDKQFVRMFAREAQLASALKHPNIVEVFDSMGLDDEENVQPECFFAMEYVHGADLSEVLRKLREESGRIPLANALLIAMSMCGGLHHAHEHRDESGHLLGIVHRDVSPSNVMLGFDGGVKITDFGVAKALALTSFTQAGTRKGKLSYMSPEQAVADPIDRRTDVFAIGAVLFELTTMRRMFGGENELAVMHKLLFRERTRPSELVSNYPPALEAIVMKATAREPDERYGSAKELRSALEEFARTSNIALSPKALGRFVASVIDAPPHPGTDPDFFKDPEDPIIPFPGNEETRAEITPGPPAQADAPTAFDQPVSSGRPKSDPKSTLRVPALPREVSATPAPRQLEGPPAPGFDEIGETAIAPSPPEKVDFGATVPSPPMAPAPLRSSSSVAASAPRPQSSGPSPWTFIVGGLVVAAAAVGGVMTMRASREPTPATSPTNVQPGPSPTAVTAPPQEQTSPPPVQQVEIIPTPAEPVEGLEPVVEVADEPAVTPAEDPAKSEDPAAVADPPPKKRGKSDDDKKTKKKRAKKPASTAPSEPAADAPTPEPDPVKRPPPPPPPPDPTKKKKKKPRTDTLLPE